MYKNFSFLKNLYSKKGWALNEREKAILLETWNHDFEFLFDLGASVFVYLFETYPKTRNVFPKLKEHGDQWYESNDFRGPIFRAVQALTTFLENINDVNCMVGALYEIGKGHTRHIKHGFQPEYWDLFQHALCLTLTDRLSKIDKLTSAEKEFAVKTWSKVIEFIIVHLKRGFTAGLSTNRTLT